MKSPIKVKVCGIKSAYEALSVASLDVDFMGVIFAPSKRRVDIATASEISQIAKSHGKKCVGVFGEMSEAEILSACKNAGLNIAQIYGGYSEDLRQNLQSEFVEIWKVFSIKDALPNLQDLNALFDRVLFDTKGTNLGGNGRSFEWDLLKDLSPLSFVLAGGIGTHNAKLAASYNPYAIDINSLVEDENGLKDPEKIKQILAQI
ncbi:MAG: phosphoribosylanthranilate isomerase [Campylobacter sp.]|nr:phosphoribosylanthranilate isomerase [Campylobacter sp.]